MDPYLEASYRWPSVHTRLLVRMSEFLAVRLPPGFYVDIEQRVYITEPGDADRQAIDPDIYIVREAARTYTSQPSSSISPAVPVEPVDLDPQIFDRFLEVRSTESRDVITTIELLSPFNKRPGAQGFSAFQQKRAEIFASSTHWLEIDLLRAGQRPVEVRDQGDYYALLKRAQRAWPYEGWFFNVRNPMPTIAVPLHPPYEDVPLDLQNIFHEMYVRARYAQSIDYSQPVPPPPLRPEDEAWARERVEAWRLETRP